MVLILSFSYSIILSILFITFCLKVNSFTFHLKSKHFPKTSIHRFQRSHDSSLILMSDGNPSDIEVTSDPITTDSNNIGNWNQPINAKSKLLQFQSRQNSLSRIELNECILQLEKTTSIPSPALSPKLNGVWELASFGASFSSPGLLAYQAIQLFPIAAIDVSEITLTISSVAPRVTSMMSLRLPLGYHLDVTVVTDLTAITENRLTERYVSCKVNTMDIPMLSSVFSLPSMDSISERDLIITYLDEDLLIVRDSFGSPEILRRKSIFHSQTGNDEGFSVDQNINVVENTAD